MTAWSILLLILSAGLMTLIRWLNHDSIFVPGNQFTINITIELLLGVVVVSVLMLILHEGLHGLVFWRITRERPKFTFKWYYASACAEGWYLPRRPYLLTSLLPLIVITIMGVILVPFSPPNLQLMLVLLVVFNASGCAGDVVVARRMMKLPAETLALDSGKTVTFYSPIK